MVRERERELERVRERERNIKNVRTSTRPEEFGMTRKHSY
jgi:hypothetical protein